MSKGHLTKPVIPACIPSVQRGTALYFQGSGDRIPAFAGMTKSVTNITEY